ncbi:MAG: hypothetical protein ACT4QC_00275 [Planctomycetaceae bacterium]
MSTTYRDKSSSDCPSGWCKSGFARGRCLTGSNVEPSADGPNILKTSDAAKGKSMIPEIGVSESALLTDIAMCLNYYRLFSPGLYCCVHAPLHLDDGTRWRPGIIVMVNHGKLKQCDPGPNYDCFHGPPNFVLDVFPADDLLDYHDRRSAFERAKVREYVAVKQSDPVAWVWNRLVDGKFEEIITADDECIMSTALPGLWIPAIALKRRDWWSIMGAIARGVSRIGHHDFMETIWKLDPSRA